MQGRPSHFYRLQFVKAAKSTGDFAFGCLDWTEPGHHLGWALGRAVTSFLTEQGWTAPLPAVRIPAEGHKPGKIRFGE